MCILARPVSCIIDLQDEVIWDLQRPSNRGLSISVSAEEGIFVSGLHKETIVDEMELRRALTDCCDK